MIKEIKLNTLAAIAIIALLVNSFLGILILNFCTANAFWIFLIIYSNNILLALLGLNSDKKVEVLPSIFNTIKGFLPHSK